MLEVRRMLKTHGQNGRIRAMLMELWKLRRAGYGGAVPPQYNDLSRVEFRRYWASLAQRGSLHRQQLAQFIRATRNNPNIGNYVRHAIRGGAASGSLAFLGGHISGRTALMRAAFGTAARTAGAFLMTPHGLAIVAVVLVVGVLLTMYLSSRAEEIALERRVATVDCDCSNINAGILNVGWIPVCREHEATLKKTCC